MKQKKDSVFNRFIKNLELSESTDASDSEEVTSEERFFPETVGLQDLYLTTPALYQAYLEGEDIEDCFKKPEDLELLKGTLYYQDSQHHVIYDMPVHINRNSGFDRPEITFLPSHAMDIEPPIFFAIVGKTHSGKTTLITETAAIGERLLCVYSPKVQCQIDFDFPLASQPYADLRRKRDDFLQGILPQPTLMETAPNDTLYPLYFRSETKDRLFVFKDHSGEILSEGVVPAPRYKDFLFVIDAEDIIRGLNDPFYCSGNEAILTNLLSFIPDYQMSAVFIQILIVKADLLLDCMTGLEQKLQTEQSASLYEREMCAVECIRSLFNPVTFDQFASEMAVHQSACQSLIRLADPVFMNRLELNLVLDGVPHFCFNGLSALGKPAKGFETGSCGFDIRHLDPLNFAAFLYGFLQAYGIFEIESHQGVVSGNSSSKEIVEPEPFFGDNFRDEDYMNNIMEKLDEIYNDQGGRLKFNEGTD